MADKRIHRSVQYAANSNKKTFSGLAEVQAYGRTDVVYQEVSLYIEGVQVPFESISVQNTYNEVPEANITIPYFPGLNEICKGYFPKVHIFYKDIPFEKYLISKGHSYTSKDVNRLLFSGVLAGTQYGKSKSTQGDNVFISFRCLHKYYVLKEIILKFGGRGVEAFFEGEQGAIAKPVEMSSAHAMILAISGIKKPEEGDTPVIRSKKGEGETGHLQDDLKKYYSRLKGIPGISLALWNIFKRDAYRFEDYAKAMTDLYIPVVDNNIRFFKRMAGHLVIEDSVEQERLEVQASDLSQQYSNYKESDPNVKILVPPAFKNFMGDAVAVDIAILLAKSGLGYSGEMVDFISMVKGFFRTIRYDMEVLASPVQSLDRDMEAVDVIVKPLLPFYFSPVCNVILPHMFSNISMNDFSYATPTRAYAKSTPHASGTGTGEKELEYRAPHEVRVSTTFNNPHSTKNLAASKIQGGEYPAPHEFGRGIKVKPLQIESWVNYLFSSQDASNIEGVNTGWSEDTTNQYSGKSSTTYKKGTASYEESNRQIFPDISSLEDPKNKARVWKYWDSTKPMPYYYGDINKKGINVVAGVAGQATGSDNTAIDTFRNTLEVPLFWNVTYYPSTNSYVVYPPHYDYVGNNWWRRRDMDAFMSRIAGAKYNDKPAGQIESVWNASTGRPTPPKQQAAKEEKKAEAAAGTTPTQTNSAAIKSTEDAPAVPSNLRGLIDSWNKRNPGFENMNPFEASTTTGIFPYEVSLFNLVDYDYSLSLVENRVGQVSGPFNPFIVSGYPMDVIEASPERPSIHAFCTSVTHQITSSSISTDVSFVSAITYDELRAYELPSILPWFLDKLGMLDKMSLMDQTPLAKQKANEYYLSTLGCGFADPSILEDADTGTANAVLVASNGDFMKNGSNVFMNSNSKLGIAQMMKKMIDPNFSWEGNMCLVRREIETQSDIEHFSGITFIGVQSRTSLSQVESFSISPLYREIKQKPGRSIFLDYTKEDDAFKKLKEKATATPDPKKST